VTVNIGFLVSVFSVTPLILICLWIPVPSEIPELADHGITLPPNMQGLTEEQIVELKLQDEWEDTCVPSGGPVLRKDEMGRRNGHCETMTRD